MPRPLRDVGGTSETKEAQAAREEEARRLTAARAARAADALLGRLPPERKSPPASRPVPPPSAPLETPVAGLKRRTVLENNFSPRAARMLYNTPTHVFTGDVPVDTKDPNVGGRYRSARSLLGTPLPYRQPDIYTVNEPDVLAHEALHKWYDREMPDALRHAWDVAWRQRIPSVAQRNMGYGADVWGESYLNPHEAFAYTGEHGPEWMSPETRSIYYEGVFNEPSRYNNPYEREEQALLAALRTPEVEDTSDGIGISVRMVPRTYDPTNPDDFIYRTQGNIPSPLGYRYGMPNADDYSVPGPEDVLNPLTRALLELRAWRQPFG